MEIKKRKGEKYSSPSYASPSLPLRNYGLADASFLAQFKTPRGEHERTG